MQGGGELICWGNRSGGMTAQPITVTTHTPIPN